jgi:twinkle protein
MPKIKIKQEKKSGKHIGHFACPSCQDAGKDKKGNNMSVYELEDGEHDGYCWSCESYYNSQDIDDLGLVTSTPKPVEKKVNQSITMTDIQSTGPKALKLRHIGLDTVKKYGVRSIDDKTFYPRFTEGNLTGYKQRNINKTFGEVGDMSTSEFWGQQLFNGGRLLIITEGEEDAMSAYQMTANESPKKTGYAAVSVPNGAKSLKKTVLANYEWLVKFEKIIFAMDQEPDVLKSVKEVCGLLPPKQAFIASFDEKDANDMLKAGKSYDFYKSVWNANEYTPEGIILSSSTWDAWKNRDNYDSVPLPNEWGLNEITKGIRLGGLYTIGAGTGVGKTTMLKILQLHLWNHTDHGVGIIALEEPLCDSVGALMGLHMKKVLNVDASNVSEADQKKAWKELFSEDRFVFEQGFGALTEDELYDKIRYMVRVKGCKYIFIDHLTILTDMFGDGKGSKIEQTARLVAGIKNLTQELDCAIIQVSHVRKRDDKSMSYEEGAIPGLDSLYGAAAIKQYSDAVITISRDQREEPSITTYHVIKNRLSGRLGAGYPLTYNYNTGWLEVKEEVM